MSDMNRRDAVKLMALVAAASTFNFSCTSEDARDAHTRRQAADTTQPGADYERRFFTDHEFATVTLLADMIIPADDRSGSASDAGVPAFIDFIMTDDMLGDREGVQTSMRGGLAWIDHQCLERFDGQLFVECSAEEREALLDSIAYPSSASEELEPGVRFFSSFRDLTATGFFTSRMGMEDLQYMGNVGRASFPGCPDEVLRHIGLADSSSA